jgi:tetratricopeptide (TPR) repeat protein
VALAALDEVLAWQGDDELNDADLRAGILHVRAEALFKLNRMDLSLASARAAAELRKDLHGCLPEYAASLALAAYAAEACDSSALDELRRLSKEAQARLNSEEDRARSELAQLLVTYEGEDARRVLDAARTRGAWRDEAVAHIAISLNAAEPMERIQNAELAVRMLEKHGERGEDRGLAHFALADALHAAGQDDRALEQYEEVLRYDPLNSVARQNFVNLLMKFERWPKAIEFLEQELKRHGKKPGLLTIYGRALLNSGEPTRAVQAAIQARAAAGNDPARREPAERLLEDAVAAGGGVVPSPPSPAEKIVTSTEFESCINEFRSAISGQQRMTFWRKDEADKHKWVERPEKHAQTLLHTWLSAKLGQRVDIIQEVGAGAGRIDLFVSAGPAFRGIVELKILGAPGYSTSYAFSGTEQIAHYMEQRHVHLGYLIILDGRRKEFGTGLKTTETVGSSTIRVVFVDVRPTVGSLGAK